MEGGRYSLTTDARKWLLDGSPTSLRDWILEQEFIEWRHIDRLEDFLRTGTALDLHADLGEDEWALYQRGIRNIASLSAGELARRVPVPRGARDTFDVVYTSILVHHLEDEENRDLARRVARALRPGGHYVIVDSVRPRSAKEAGQIGTLGDLFFALTSRAGTWSFEEMAHWQRSAGLDPRKPIRLRTGPGVGVQWAVKQATS